MFNSLEFFTQSVPTHVFIVTGDRKSWEQLVVTQKGKVKFQMPSGKIITLSDSLCVPNLTQNLISFAQLVERKIVIQQNSGIYEVISNDHEKLFNLDFSNQLFEIDGNIAPLPYSTTALLNSVKEPSGFTKWHSRLGHALVARIKAVLLAGENLIKDQCCDSCMKGKLTWKPFNSHFDKTTTPLEVVHGNLVGPISPLSNEGSRYFLTLVDQHTGYIRVTILKEKGKAAKSIKKFMAFHKTQTGHKLKKLITNGGGEFCNNQLSEWLDGCGIQHNVSPPYTPQNNGVAERVNHTILDMTRCMLVQSNLAPQWWPEAVKDAVAVTNCLPSLSRSRTSPIELLFKKQPNINIFCPFGCRVWSVKPTANWETKFDLVAWQGVLVGAA
jgi:hypothetical protein